MLQTWKTAGRFKYCKLNIGSYACNTPAEKSVLECIHSFISGMHHYECVAPNVDINFHSGRFWATAVASFRERFNDSRSCWVVFILVVWGRPGGLLQFSKGEAVKICLASDSSGIRALRPNRERCRAWTVAERCGCYVFRLTSTCYSTLGSTIWFPTAYADTIDREHICIYPSWV